MGVTIFSDVAEKILRLCAAAHPLEACGLLVGHGDRIEEAIPAPNVAADPSRAFEIDPATLLRVHRAAREGGCELLGWYHSHPNGRPDPSPDDAAQAVEEGRLWLIVANGAFRAYRWTGAGFVQVPCSTSERSTR